MNIFALTLFITGGLAGLTGLFVFLSNKKRKVNQLWFFFNLSITAWLIGLGKTMTVNNPEAALFWQRILYIGTIFIPYLFLYFCVVFTEKEEKFKKLLKINLLLVIIFIFSLFYGHLFIGKIKSQTDFGYWPVETGWLYYPFLLWFIFNVIYAFRLLKKRLKEKGLNIIEKNQVLIIYYGTLIGFVAGSVNFLLDFNIIFPPFHNFFVIFYLIFTAFAVARYNLFGIVVILTELLVGAIGTVLFIQMFVTPMILWKIINGIVFSLFVFFGYYLIRATIREIERKKEAEKIALQERELRIKAEKLAEETEKLSRAKDQFLLSIQHHLRTPFTPIRGYISMILEGVYGEEKNPKIKEKLIAIKKSVDTLHNLMEELLDIQQIRMGKPILNLESSHLEDLIEDIINEVKPEIEQRNLSVEFKKIILPEIKIDKKRIREVIWNLLDNAIKYTPDKGKIEIRAEKKEENDKEFILFSVSDTGIGMEKEEINYFLEGKIFERGQEAKKLYGPGRGIGLAISLEFVKAHGGKMWIESGGRGKGTTFYVELPLK